MGKPRLLEVGDAAGLAALHCEAFQTGWAADVFAAWLEDGRYRLIGIDADDRFAAMLVLRVVAGEAEIITIATSAKKRRRGHARRLLNHVIAMAPTEDVASLWLEVSEDNEAAQALYKSSGFTVAGRREGYYRTENRCRDAVLYRRNL